jgi:DNA modification methylase
MQKKKTHKTKNRYSLKQNNEIFLLEDKNLHPEIFKEEITTVWSFPDRGDWATHKGDFPGNWAPQIPRNLLLRYSKEGDTVLDPMVGSGTTLIECKLLNRNAIGFDINPEYVKLTKQRLNFNVTNADIKVEIGDARDLSRIKNESIDFILTHPPYANMIKYSDNKIEGDLSNIGNIKKFCDEIEIVAKEFYRVLKYDKFCAILIGSTRKNGMFIPIPHMILDRFLKVGFKLKEEIIKVQHNCSSTPYWKNQSKRFNFFLIMHENLFVFKKYKCK